MIWSWDEEAGDNLVFTMVKYKNWMISYYETPPSPWHTGDYCCHAWSNINGVQVGFNEERKKLEDAFEAVKDRIDSGDYPKP